MLFVVLSTIKIFVRSILPVLLFFLSFLIKAYGIHNAVIVDNTGIWRTEKDLSRHLVSKGASQVVLTAPGKGDMPNLVMGVNSEQYLGTFKGKILSAASCSTNAVVPVIKLIDDKFGYDSLKRTVLFFDTTNQMETCEILHILHLYVLFFFFSLLLYNTQH